MFTVISRETGELWGIGDTCESALHDAEKSTFHDLHPAKKTPSLIKFEEITVLSEAYFEIKNLGEDAFIEHGYSVHNGEIVRDF